MEKFATLLAEVQALAPRCTTGAASLWLELHSRLVAGNLKASEDAMRVLSWTANPGRITGSNNRLRVRLERFREQIDGSLGRNPVSPQRADKLFTQLAAFVRMTAGREDGMARIRELARDMTALGELAEAAMEFRERALAPESVIKPRLTDGQVTQLLDCFRNGAKPLREVADKLLVSALSPAQAAAASACFANKWREQNPSA